eukprot:CAMPEP_0185739786 /NCGR_PEP_ID=MMETSP1171-20130828/36254_1 /TAXON_ID=374046 /ORGANISM="Helicotheca tamensis, Strain CCMP826" /LENGTH=661 /DNA_ID=CAMNT_0028411441 /DNA_START=136 /DNA_END=2121 /DNA_ORIENTATION=+
MTMRSSPGRTASVRKLGILQGGRSPGVMDNIASDQGLAPTGEPPKSSEARLTIVQVTDVYTLEHFACIKTMLAEKRASLTPGSKVISMLTGDFLAPYLLSSVDKGKGMMNALAKTPIDYLTWGNHEADIDHRSVCRHVEQFPGTWLNTNMQDHEAMDHQEPYDVVEITSADGTNTRRVGLAAVLSDDPDLYSSFRSPGAFGGATIRDPWETLREYKEILENDENCDVVLPLQHTYVPDDHKTCKEFDFPVILSGHDHHKVDEIVDGTRLLKPGLDAIYATVLELSWDDASSESKPTVRAKFVKTDEWKPDPGLKRENDRAYDALRPLRNTELARVPPTFAPLSSVNARGKVCTMGKFICSLLKSSLNVSRRQREHLVDAVLLMGGNIRGGTDYPLGSFFSLEALEAEIKPDEAVGVVKMPGWLIADGVIATHSGDPIPGWVQFDDGVKEEYPKNSLKGPIVTHVAGKEIERGRIYRVATKISDLTNGQSPPWTEYYNAHPELLPPKGAYANVHAELMGFFARNMWRKIWDAIGPPAVSKGGKIYSNDPSELCTSLEECDPEGRLSKLDREGNGVVTVDEIHDALRDVIGLSVDPEEKSLAEFVHSFADTTGNGVVTLEDFETFCEEMPAFYESQKWRLAFPRITAEKVGSPQQFAGSAQTP